MLEITNQERYVQLCSLVGDIEVQLSELTATKTILLRQIHQLKLDDAQRTTDEKLLEESPQD